MDAPLPARGTVTALKPIGVGGASLGVFFARIFSKIFVRVRAWAGPADMSRPRSRAGAMTVLAVARSPRPAVVLSPVMDKEAGAGCVGLEQEEARQRVVAAGEFTPELDGVEEGE
jgi:hypothetical protein